MTRKTLEKHIRSISRTYLSLIHSVHTLKSNSEIDSYLSLVESSYSRLSKLSQLIINNEFFYGDYPDWWRDSFSSPLFLKLKKEAMEQFWEEFIYEA